MSRILGEPLLILQASHELRRGDRLARERLEWDRREIFDREGNLGFRGIKAVDNPLKSIGADVISCRDRACDGKGFRTAFSVFTGRAIAGRRCTAPLERRLPFLWKPSGIRCHSRIPAHVKLRPGGRINRRARRILEGERRFVVIVLHLSMVFSVNTVTPESIPAIPRRQRRASSRTCRARSGFRY